MTVHYRNAGPVFYREAGDPSAPTVLLLHGFPTSSHMFRDLIPLLAEHYHVVAPDLPGFGFSESPDRSTFDRLAAIIDTFTDTIGLSRYAIYVFDYGAPVGFRLALAHPERITAIISQNGNAYAEGLSVEGWNPIQNYWRSPTAENRTALRAFLQPEATKWQYSHGVSDASLLAPEAWTLDSALLARPGNDEIQLDLFLDYASNVALYPKFQAYFRAHQPPLLAVWGKNDPFFLPVGAEAFKRDIPNAEVRFLDTGHFALETHVTEIANAILRFLGRHLGGESALARAHALYGFTPNLAVAMSADGAALDGFLDGMIAFSHTSLGPLEQQIVMMAASRASANDYSVAVHATAAAALGASPDVLHAIAERQPIADPRLEAIRRFAEALAVSRGKIADADRERFVSAGFNDAAVIAVAFGVAVKTFAHHIVHLTHPAIDAEFAPALAGV